MFERAILIVAAISLALYGVYSDIIGISLAIVVLVIQITRKRKMSAVAE